MIFASLKSGESWLSNGVEIVKIGAKSVEELA
ncbi:hypothetical protein Vi05172_g13336 [Venturia inaequalis]|nr:hypothetical protein Vi05172_g13336 [Venturia inaequalis]